MHFPQETICVTFRSSCFKTVLGPLLGPFWGPLGGAFWLKSRLKIGQEPPRPLLEYFFSAPGPSPGPFGGPSGSFRDLSKIKKPQEGPRKAQNGPPGRPRKAPREPQMPPPESPERDPNIAKQKRSDEPRITIQEKTTTNKSAMILYTRLGYREYISFRLWGPQALRL